MHVFLSVVFIGLWVNLAAPFSVNRPPNLASWHYSSRLRQSTRQSDVDTMDYNNVILYDGVCNFCNTWVDLILRIDSQKQFRFAPLQSKHGMYCLEQIGKAKDDISSVILINTNREGELQGLSKSEAVVEVLNTLQFPLVSPMAQLVSTLLPISIKNDLYDTVAKNRYIFLGKRTTIERLNGDYSDRFLS
jgi:predicted DCC family thiol-disulfide oxidoreductase YuxK